MVRPNHSLRICRRTDCEELVFRFFLHVTIHPHAFSKDSLSAGFLLRMVLGSGWVQKLIQCGSCCPQRAQPLPGLDWAGMESPDFSEHRGSGKAKQETEVKGL